MKPTATIKEKFKLFLIIMTPILVTQLGMYLMTFFDTAMSGQAGAEDLAGVAIGSSIWFPIFTGLSGVLLAIVPILSQSIGAGKEEEVPFSLIQGVYLSIFLSIVLIIAGIFLLEPLLAFMSLENDVAHIALHYLIGLSFGILSLFVYTVLRSFIDSLGHTRVTMVITLLALPINVFFNYVLIFGAFRFPRLGGIGAGYATAITYWVILFITLFFVVKVRPFSHYPIFNKLYTVSLSKWKEILLLGLPIGFTIFFETSIFSAVTLLMSEFATTTIAAHQAALNFSSLLYMIPLSVALTLTIAVGFEVGANRLEDARQYGFLGLTIAVIISIGSGLIIYFFREPVSMIYTTDPVVSLLTQQFLVFAVFFQLSDAIAAPIQGALRGYKDVNIPFVIALISFWFIGLPAGYMLANFTTLGPFGYWLGLIIGLATGAIGLSFRLRAVRKKVEKIQYSH